MRTHPAAFVLLVTTLLAATAAAQGWSTGGGDAARTGLSAADGPAVKHSAWNGSLSAVVSQQAFTDGNVVVTARMIDIVDVAGGTWIVAHHVATGQLLWQTQLPAEPGSWRNHVVGFRDGQVYATRAGNELPGFLYALRPTTGAVIWKSIAKLRTSTTESPGFAENGDVVFKGDGNTLVRIRAADGTTAWATPYIGAASDARSPGVFGNRIYAWDPFIGGWGVQAFDLATGAKVYDTGAVGNYSGQVQQAGLMIGPDGTLYAPRIGQQIAAFTDTGSALVLKWSTPMGNAVFSHGGIGPDGTIYTFSPQQEVMRLDPATGGVLDASMPIPTDFFQPRLAIDSEGRVYLTNGGFSQGSVFCFTPDLQLLWSDSVPGVNVGGPALAADGTLVVCGTGTTVRAYRDGLVAYGTGTPGCFGTHSIGASTAPVVGDAAFAIVGGEAPANALGLGLVGDVQALAGVDPFSFGILFHVDLLASSSLFALNAFSDGAGNAAAPAPLPGDPGLVGVTLYAQLIWAWPGGVPCQPSPLSLSTSRGLAITFLAP